MPRTRTLLPTYQKHSSGRARVRIYDANGKRVEVILPGEYGSQVSKDAYPSCKASAADLVLKFMER